jgi:hypothetical protein
MLSRMPGLKATYKAQRIGTAWYASKLGPNASRRAKKTPNSKANAGKE